MTDIQFPALTLWQPWATLLVAGYKRHETRSWRPAWRERWIAVHAAKKEPPWVRDAMQAEHPAGWAAAAWRCLQELGVERYAELPRGCVLGMADVTGILPACEADPATDDDALLGDWSAGRYAWRVGRVCQFARPVPARGRQRLWPWTPDAASLRAFRAHLP